MSKEYDANIFEAATRQSLAKKSSRSASASRKENQTATPQEHPVSSDEEIEEMLRKMKQLQRNLDKTIDRAFEDLKLDPEKLSEFSESIQGINREAAEKNMKALETTLESAVGVKVTKQKMKQETAKADKTRKSKMLPGRKKWMPVR